MTNILMSTGQALSTWPQLLSGSVHLSNSKVFEDPRQSNSTRPARIQGFIWSGAASLLLTDEHGTHLFSGTSNSPSIWPPEASGSVGLILNMPLYATTSGAAMDLGNGGTLIVYGEVL